MEPNETVSKNFKEKNKIIEGLEMLKKLVTFSETKENFIKELSNNLPFNANPELQTYDGSYIDIFWNNYLLITIDDEDSVSVTSNFINDVDKFVNETSDFKYFKNPEEAISFIVKAYNKICSIN